MTLDGPSCGGRWPSIARGLIGSRNVTADGVFGSALGSGYVPPMGKREKVIKRTRRAVKEGRQPTFEVDVARRVVPELPGLEFDGRRPPEIVEAARRSIAAELGVRAHEILVEHVDVVEVLEPVADGSSPEAGTG